MISYFFRVFAILRKLKETKWFKARIFLEGARKKFQEAFFAKTQV
jgi:hypothetical protein